MILRPKMQIYLFFSVIAEYGKLQLDNLYSYFGTCDNNKYYNIFRDTYFPFQKKERVKKGKKGEELGGTNLYFTRMCIVYSTLGGKYYLRKKWKVGENTISGGNKNPCILIVYYF